LALLMTWTLLLDAVVSVDPILKMNTALGSPWASRVSVPVSWAEDPKQYTPGGRVSPPRSCPVRSLSQGRPAASSYAATRSNCAPAATASPARSTPPVTTPGGKPVMAVPGLTPRSR